MDKTLKEFVYRNLDNGNIHYKKETFLNDFSNFFKSIFSIMDSKELGKVNYYSRITYLSSLSYLIYTLSDKPYFTNENPLDSEDQYKNYTNLYKKLLTISLKENKFLKKDWSKFFLDTAFHHPNVFWVCLECFYKISKEDTLNAIKEVSKLSNKKYHLLDYFLSNYKPAYRAKKKYQTNINLSYRPAKVSNEILAFISKNKLYTSNPINHIVLNYHKDTPFLNLFLKYFPVTHKTLSFAYEQKIPKSKIQLILDSSKYEEIIKKDLIIKKEQNQFDSWCQKIIKGKFMFDTDEDRLKPVELSNTLLDLLYEDGYSLDQSLLDYQINQYKFIQNQLKDSLNFKSKKNRILNPKIASMFKRFKNYKSFVKNLTGFDTPYAMKMIGSKLINKKVINQNYVLSVYLLRKILKGREISPEQFFRISHSSNFRKITEYYDSYRFNENEFINFMKIFSNDRIEKLMTNDVQDSDKGKKENIFRDSVNMFNKHPEIKEKLLALKFSKINTISKLHNRLVEISSYYDVSYKDFRTKETKELFSNKNNIKINSEYTLVLPKNSIVLKSWSNLLHNCIGNGSYGDRFANGDIILYGLYKDDLIQYAIEIDNKNIVQCEGKYRKKMDDNIFDQIFDKLVELKLIKE